jgi:hypothetical protein
VNLRTCLSLLLDAAFENDFSDLKEMVKLENRLQVSIYFDKAEADEATFSGFIGFSKVEKQFEKAACRSCAKQTHISGMLGMYPFGLYFEKFDIF